MTPLNTDMELPDYKISQQSSPLFSPGPVTAAAIQ